MKQMPVYVTRKTINGENGEFRLNMWAAFAIYVLAALNALGWGVFGLIALGSKVV